MQPARFKPRAEGRTCSPIRRPSHRVMHLPGPKSQRWAVTGIATPWSWTALCSKKNKAATPLGMDPMERQLAVIQTRANDAAERQPLQCPSKVLPLRPPQRPWGGPLSMNCV
jgi:hypothetical protein